MSSCRESHSALKHGSADSKGKRMCTLARRVVPRLDGQNVKYPTRSLRANSILESSCSACGVQQWRSAGPILFLWLDKILANKWKSYIRNFFSHSLRLCPGIDRKGGRDEVYFQCIHSQIWCKTQLTDTKKGRPRKYVTYFWLMFTICRSPLVYHRWVLKSYLC